MLERVNFPEDIRGLSYDELRELAWEIRQRIIEVVGKTGGHMGPNLGVVELTLAVHRVFDARKDRIIWDVGHQGYAHKLITGRKDVFHTLRQYQGLSGFIDPSENPYDHFGVGHAGTSISAAVGMALARQLKGEDYHVVAIIGDGSLGTGMAFEALNFAGEQKIKLIVILNDNGMSISPTVGALARFLNKIRFSPHYELAKQALKEMLSPLPLGQATWQISKRLKDSLRKALLGSAFWEGLGFLYLGPVDGHDIEELEAALKRASQEKYPTLVHILTVKGKGYAQAERDAEHHHAISGKSSEPESPNPTYSQILGNCLLRLMKDDHRIVAITAAMRLGTGLYLPAKEFPDRVFDVGICEQHAVTMAAGLACQGMIPIVAIYSTFLQRAYDQIIHDVCIQNLPVVFCVDRAGIVEGDGKTHQGEFDISYLRFLPNMIVSAPKDGQELCHLLYTAVKSGRPFAIRYPKDHSPDMPDYSFFKQIPVGKGEVLSGDENADLAIIAVGSAVYPSLKAAERLSRMGIKVSVVNACFVKPLDRGLILSIAKKCPRLLTVEENVLAGGFGSAVLELLAEENIRCSVARLGLPDKFIEHGPLKKLHEIYLIDGEGIARYAFSAFPGLGGVSTLPKGD